MPGRGSHRLLIPLLGLIVGIGSAWNSLPAGPGLSVPLLLGFLLFRCGRRGCARRGGQPSLRLALAGLFFSAVFGFVSGQLAFPASMQATFGRVDTVCVGAVEQHILVGDCFTEAGGWVRRRVRLRLSTGLTDDKLSGGVLAISGVLVPNRPPRNPGEPDWPSIARASGQWATMETRGLPLVLKVRPPSMLSQMQRAMLTRHDALFGRSTGSGLVASISLGLRSRISENVQETFRKAGLAHLLALSGFHLAVVGIGLLGAMSLVLGRAPVSPALRIVLQSVLTLTGISLFAWVTGGAASTVRAAIMAGLLLARSVFQRGPGQPIHLLLLAVWGFLVLDPGQLFKAGLPLSALAVYGLMVDARATKNWLVPSACAIMTTAPVVAGLFREVAMVGLVSNVVAVPLASVVIIGSAVAQLTSVFIPLLACLVAEGTAYAADALILVAQVFSGMDPRWPLSLARGMTSIRFAAESGWLLAAGFVLGRIPRTPAGRRWVTFAGLIAVAVPLSANLTLPGPLRLDMVDVGQGDALLIRFPHGKTMMVDFGPDPEANALLDYLSFVGISRLDYAVVTHDHEDHTGGLPAVMKAVVVDSVIAPGPLPRITPDRRAYAGSMIPIDENTRVMVLAPDSTEANPNDNSLVLKIQHGQVSLLLTGDAELRTEEHLVRRWGGLLQSQVVKVAHHGSDTSSHRFLVSRVATSRGIRWALVSVASRNRYGLPDHAALQHWHGAGFRILSTATSGAVSCLSSGHQVVCTPFLASL